MKRIRGTLCGKQTHDLMLIPATVLSLCLLGGTDQGSSHSADELEPCKILRLFWSSGTGPRWGQCELTLFQNRDGGNEADGYFEASAKASSQDHFLPWLGTSDKFMLSVWVLFHFT